MSPGLPPESGPSGSIGEAPSNKEAPLSCGVAAIEKAEVAATSSSMLN